MLLSLVACSLRSPFFFVFLFLFSLFFFSLFFLSLGACVCVCLLLLLVSSFFSSHFSFLFLLPFLSWPSFFRSFLLLRSGEGSPGLRRLLLAGNPLLFFLASSFPPSWGYARGSRQPLFTGICPPDCRRLPVFVSPASARWLVFVSSLLPLPASARWLVFFFFFLFLCFLLLLRLLPLAGLFCCFGRLLSLSFGLVAVVSGPVLGSMDLLPDVVLSAVSDSSDGSADQNCPAPLPPRLLLPVGKCRRLPSFTGTCYGDQVSWKGSSSTRIVSLQSGGAGRDRYLWGRHWGQSLTTLGADIGVIAETRIRGADHHALAIRGLWDAGFLSLSHGCDAGLPRGQDPAHYCLVQQMWAVGVVLAVRKDYLGNWSAVQRDSAGHGLARNLTLQNGVVLRVIGVYGPSGASLPGFASNGARGSLLNPAWFLGFLLSSPLVRRKVGCLWSLGISILWGSLPLIVGRRLMLCVLRLLPPLSRRLVW